MTSLGLPLSTSPRAPGKGGGKESGRPFLKARFPVLIPYGRGKKKRGKKREEKKRGASTSRTGWSRGTGPI